MLKITMPEDAYLSGSEDSLGVCLACGDREVEQVEPDTARRKCPACGQRAVYGYEQALIMGQLEFTEEGE